MPPPVPCSPHFCARCLLFWPPTLTFLPGMIFFLASRPTLPPVQHTGTGGKEPPWRTPALLSHGWSPSEASSSLAPRFPSGVELQMFTGVAGLVTHSLWAALLPLSSPCSQSCFLCCLNKILASSLLLGESRLRETELMN